MKAVQFFCSGLVRSNPAPLDLAKILFTCSVVFTYTIIFAAVDLRCDLTIASNIFVDV